MVSAPVAGGSKDGRQRPIPKTKPPYFAPTLWAAGGCEPTSSLQMPHQMRESRSARLPQTRQNWSRAFPSVNGSVEMCAGKKKKTGLRLGREIQPNQPTREPSNEVGNVFENVPGGGFFLTSRSPFAAMGWPERFAADCRETVRERVGRKDEFGGVGFLFVAGGISHFNRKSSLAEKMPMSVLRKDAAVTWRPPPKDERKARMEVKRKVPRRLTISRGGARADEEESRVFAGEFFVFVRKHCERGLRRAAGNFFKRKPLQTGLSIFGFPNMNRTRQD